MKVNQIRLCYISLFLIFIFVTSVCSIRRNRRRNRAKFSPDNPYQHNFAGGMRSKSMHRGGSIYQNQFKNVAPADTISHREKVNRSPRHKSRLRYRSESNAAASSLSSSRGGWRPRRVRRELHGDFDENIWYGTTTDLGVPPIAEGVVPQVGPYPDQSLATQVDSEEVSDEFVSKRNKVIRFRNWAEYKEHNKMKGLKARTALSGEGEFGGRSYNKVYSNLKYTPVIDSDRHFRDIDKLFKLKNERVKAFYKLNLRMQKQGKKFQYPTMLPIDYGERCEDGRPPPCNGIVLF